MVFRILSPPYLLPKVVSRFITPQFTEVGTVKFEGQIPWPQVADFFSYSWLFEPVLYMYISYLFRAVFKCACCFLTALVTQFCFAFSEVDWWFFGEIVREWPGVLELCREDGVRQEGNWGRSLVGVREGQTRRLAQTWVWWNSGPGAVTGLQDGWSY